MIYPWNQQLAVSLRLIMTKIHSDYNSGFFIVLNNQYMSFDIFQVELITFWQIIFGSFEKIFSEKLHLDSWVLNHFRESFLQLVFVSKTLEIIQEFPALPPILLTKKGKIWMLNKCFIINHYHSPGKISKKCYLGISVKI